MSESLKRTPLAGEHEALGAKMVDFGGWTMPIQYSGLVEEHLNVRERVGLFDVSHMGEIRVTGEDTIAYLDYLTVNDVTKLKDGQAHYTLFAYPEGTVVDDLLIYRISAQEMLLVVNAGNQDKDFEWMCGHRGSWRVQVANEGPQTGQLALQGPQAEVVLQPLVEAPLGEIGYYHFVQTHIGAIPALVSRTGYTGEDGFECYVAAEQTAALWRLLLEAGKEAGILPIGLGARDTLRLEARMHLYGNDMDETTSVLEAGLGWVTKLKKASDFIGKDALAALKKAGLNRKLVGFELLDKGVARHGYAVVHEGETVGRVTSGSHAPSLKKSIGLAYVPKAMAKPDSIIHIQIRKKVVAAQVVKGAFYKRA